MLIFNFLLTRTGFTSQVVFLKLIFFLKKYFKDFYATFTLLFYLLCIL